MTIKEFSDAFDVLLASYNHKTEFGDQTSYADVTLDEYEKSVFLTQAQDSVIKRYFDNRSDTLAEGFDGSIRRQADFSSLITTDVPSRVTVSGSTWQKNSITFNNTYNTLIGGGNQYAGFKLACFFGSSSSSIDVQYTGGVCIINLYISSSESPKSFYESKLQQAEFGDGTIHFQVENPNQNNYLGIMTITTPITSGQFTISSYPTGSSDAYDARGVLFRLPENILLMLNERIKTSDNQYQVVIPISYKEYDRQMSRAYSQPLKKQAWRLFEGENNVNTISEVIPKEGTKIDYYKIRYIRRPDPIILVDLGFNASQEPLQIDGHREATECELNPIIHMDILEEAVRLALNSKGIETRDQKAQREQQSRNNRS